MYSDEPWKDEDARQHALEVHMAMFPICNECGRSLMNIDVCVHIGTNWYCDYCAEVMNNSEMREYIGID